MERRTLSPRELEILTWAAKGKTYWEIARILGIAYASVHSHINSFRLKLNAVNTTHAVARGYELGLIELRTAEPRVMMAVTLTLQRPEHRSGRQQEVDLTRSPSGPGMTAV
jgi:LuxR family transcriptional regulator, transcriptional regulator of spore coat protein